MPVWIRLSRKHPYMYNNKYTFLLSTHHIMYSVATRPFALAMEAWRKYSRFLPRRQWKMRKRERWRTRSQPSLWRGASEGWHSEWLSLSLCDLLWLLVVVCGFSKTANRLIITWLNWFKLVIRLFLVTERMSYGFARVWVNLISCTVGINSI